VLQHSGFLSEGHAGRSPRRATDVDGNHICNLCGRHVALLLVLLAIVIGVPPVSATVATPREDCMRSAGRDNLDNPDPLNIAEFAVEHVESHQGSAVSAVSDDDNVLSFFCWRSACRGECICSGALLWTVVPRAFC
jgi:hypothetical protein